MISIKVKRSPIHRKGVLAHASKTFDSVTAQGFIPYAGEKYRYEVIKGNWDAAKFYPARKWKQDPVVVFTYNQLPAPVQMLFDRIRASNSVTRLRNSPAKSK